MQLSLNCKWLNILFQQTYFVLGPRVIKMSNRCPFSSECLFLVFNVSFHHLSCATRSIYFPSFNASWSSRGDKALIIFLSCIVAVLFLHRKRNSYRKFLIILYPPYNYSVVFYIRRAITKYSMTDWNYWWPCLSMVLLINLRIIKVLTVLYYMNKRYSQFKCQRCNRLIFTWIFFIVLFLQPWYNIIIMIKVCIR